MILFRPRLFRRLPALHFAEQCPRELPMTSRDPGIGARRAQGSHR
jgi:hypothetical protein